MTVPDDMEQFAAAVGPPSDDVIAEMDERAAETGFPTVGPAVGGWLAQLADAVDSRRVFEFGSGFGYSAYWFARVLPDDGEVVLTEVDADELQDARRYLDRGGYADLARFEHGDAVEIVDEYDGPFDVVLVDNEKERYVEAFEAVSEKVAEGGLVLADNMTAGPLAFDAIFDVVVAGETPDDDVVEGVASYLERLRSDDDFVTTLLPLGGGVAVSRRVG